jgi:glycerol-3-phosphate dehydrogenase (NAD(P)+)
VGIRLGKGEKLEDITATMKGAVAEGVLTSRSAHHLAQKMGIECPVIEGIYRVRLQIMCRSTTAAAV